MTDTPVDASESPVEVELKFRMTDVAAGDRLLAAADLAGLAALGPAVTVVNDDRYVDTAGHDLEAAGYAGRLRTAGRTTVITLKGLRRADSGGALHRREELEGPADGRRRPSMWPQSDARDRVIEIAGDTPLVDLVTIHQTRRKRNYGRDGSVVELSVDDVEVRVGDLVIERFAEVELELREGDEASLEPVAELLSEVEELVPAETSKLERALDAVRRHTTPAPDEVAGPDEGDPDDEGPAADGADTADGAARESVTLAEANVATVAVPPAPAVAEPVATPPDGPSGTGSAEPHEEAGIDAADLEPPRPVLAKSPGVLAEDHLAEAGRKVLHFHLARMVAREAGTRTGRDNEELHAMRVATRRQRAAWRVFGEAFDPGRTARHRRRLRDVAADLGGVRDLDVLIEAAEAYRDRQSAIEAEAFDRLIEGWRVQRDAARVVLLKELDSEKYRRWVEDYVAFVQVEGLGVMPVGATQPHRVRDTMPSRIWAAYEGVRAYEPVLRWADVTTLHDLRIAAKWLRYTLEFVREALGREAGPVIEKVVALQDHLGWLHDADVAAALARQHLVEHAGELSELESAAIGRYLVDRERELARLRRTVGPAWRGVSSLAFRRALGRLVAGL